MSSVTLWGCFTSATQAGGWRLAIPELHVGKGNWKQQCLSEGTSGSDSLLDLCWGGVEQMEMACRFSSLDGWSLNLSLSKAASVPGMISHLAYAL